MFLYYSLTNSYHFLISKDQVDCNLTKDESKLLTISEESGVLLKERFELVSTFSCDGGEDVYEMACQLIKEYLGGYPGEFLISYNL